METQKEIVMLMIWFSGASLIWTPLIWIIHLSAWTHVWEPIPIPQQKVTHLSGNSVIRTVSLGTEVSGRSTVINYES